MLNLGIDRSRLGDILVEEHQAYLFCQEKIADFICENLTRIRHTTIMAVRVEAEDFDYQPKFQEIVGTVASVRLDSLLSLAFGASRSGLTGLIEGGKVFVNGKITLSNSQILKPGDIISARGYGKFIYRGFISNTKKGRMFVALDRYA